MSPGSAAGWLTGGRCRRRREHAETLGAGAGLRYLPVRQLARCEGGARRLGPAILPAPDRAEPHRERSGTADRSSTREHCRRGAAKYAVGCPISTAARKAAARWTQSQSPQQSVRSPPAGNTERRSREARSARGRTGGFRGGCPGGCRRESITLNGWRGVQRRGSPTRSSQGTWRAMRSWSGLPWRATETLVKPEYPAGVALPLFIVRESRIRN